MPIRCRLPTEGTSTRRPKLGCAGVRSKATNGRPRSGGPVSGSAHPTPSDQKPTRRRYNCIAFAAGDTQNWWWADLTEEDTWPLGVARVATVEGFRDAFTTLGYVVCNDD